MKAAGAFNGLPRKLCHNMRRCKAVSQELNDNCVKGCPGRRRDRKRPGHKGEPGDRWRLRFI